MPRHPARALSASTPVAESASQAVAESAGQTVEEITGRAAEETVGRAVEAHSGQAVEAGLTRQKEETSPEGDGKSVVRICTDGACSGNPGPGGWGALIGYGNHEKTLSGYAHNTTNNRMEMLAAVRALETLKRPCRVTMTTDSQYVKQGITQWIHRWKKRGWRKADGKAVLNVDLWKKLDALCAQHEVNWNWVRGHAGHPENERADQLARDGLQQGRQGMLAPDLAGASPGGGVTKKTPF